MEPKRSKLESSDIARLEKELEEETKKCNSAVDEAIPLAEELRKRTEKSDKFRVRKNGNGTIAVSKDVHRKK